MGGGEEVGEGGVVGGSNEAFNMMLGYSYQISHSGNSKITNVQNASEQMKSF